MSQVIVHVIENQAYIKQAGKVTKAMLIRTNTVPQDDPIPVLTAEQKAQQKKQEYFEQKLNALKEAIEDAKQKAELVKLGIEEQAELDRKIKEYKTAKAEYDLAK